MISALAFRSTLTSRSTGSSITRKNVSMGGRGPPPSSAPRTLRSTDTLSTRAPSGKSIPRKKMSLHPLCVRSMRTGVASCKMGKSPLLRDPAPSVLAARAAGGRPGARCGTSTGCRGRIVRCAAPGRPASGSRGYGMRQPVRWRCRRSARPPQPARAERRRWPLQSGAEAGCCSPSNGISVCAEVGCSGRWKR